MLLQNCFELYNPNHKGQVIKACKTEADGRVVEGNHVVYRISAPTPEEKEEWIKSIKYDTQHTHSMTPTNTHPMTHTNTHNTTTP